MRAEVPTYLRIRPVPPTPIEIYLQGLDDLWSHPWESLAGALEGVGEIEATWQPPAYADEDVEEGWPLPGTLAWHVAHLAHCKRHYAQVVRGRESAQAVAVRPRRPLASFAEERAALAAAQAELRAALAEVPGDALTLHVGTEASMQLSTFLAAILRHDAWHAGQIAMVRRLHRKR